MSSEVRRSFLMKRTRGWAMIVSAPAITVALLGASFIAWAYIPWGSIFVVGEEPMLALLRDPNHLAFEAITGIGQTLVINVLVLALVWPRIRAHFHRDIDSIAASEHDRIDHEDGPADLCSRQVGDSVVYRGFDAITLEDGEEVARKIIHDY